MSNFCIIELLRDRILLKVVWQRLDFWQKRFGNFYDKDLCQETKSIKPNPQYCLEHSTKPQKGIMICTQHTAQWVADCWFPVLPHCKSFLLLFHHFWMNCCWSPVCLVPATLFMDRSASGLFDRCIALICIASNNQMEVPWHRIMESSFTNLRNMQQSIQWLGHYGIPPTAE